MASDQTISTHAGPPMVPPRGVAISGTIFGTLFVTSLVLVRLAVPVDPTDRGDWLADPAHRDSVRVALNLVPFTGIAFLWFMGVLRNRIGHLEDRFFATVFLGSGFLFVAMLFGTVAIAAGLMETFTADSPLPAGGETYAVGRRISYVLMTRFALKMAAVFMFMTSTIGLRTAVLPRWLAFTGYAVGLVLLLAITDYAWIALLFPMWVFLVSAYILIDDIRRTQKPRETKVPS